MNFIRDMTEIEIKVLNAIKNGASFDLPIQARELRQDLGLSKRKLEEIIESLRVTFRQPIVAKKISRMVIICHETRKNAMQVLHRIGHKSEQNRKIWQQ